MNIKQLRQAVADNDAAQATLRAEGRTLMAVAERSPEQAARLAALEQELDTLVATRARLAQDLARAERFADDERASAGVTGTTVVVGQDRAVERPWAERVEGAVRPVAVIGEFAQAVYRAGMGQGIDPRLHAAASGMGITSGEDGGFAVPQEVAPGIEREMYEQGQILSRVDARDISGNAITYNVVDETSRSDGSRQGGVLGYWVDEGTAPDPTKTKLARMEMKLRKVATLGYMTDELMADAIALGGELAAMFTDELMFQVENKIFRGTGSGSPLGFLSAPCLVTVNKETGQGAATINTTNLSNMWSRLPGRSKANAVWLINGDIEPQLDLLSIPAGTGALEPRFVTYGPDGTLRIKGRPVIDVEYCETLGTVGDIALVDLRRYRLVRKGGVQTASSIHVRFVQGENTLRAIYRCDGQPVPRSAVTPFKGSSTKSPFVVLQTRA